MARPTIARIPQQIAMGSVLNWDTTNSRDPKELAHAAMQANTLTNLVVGGLTLEGGGTGPGPDRRDSLVREAAALSELLCFCLARELGALDDEPKERA